MISCFYWVYFENVCWRRVQRGLRRMECLIWEGCRMVKKLISCIFLMNLFRQDFFLVKNATSFNNNSDSFALSGLRSSNSPTIYNRGTLLSFSEQFKNFFTRVKTVSFFTLSIRGNFVHPPSKQNMNTQSNKSLTRTSTDFGWYGSRVSQKQRL